MVRPSNDLWQHCTKERIPGRSHPKVTCNYCPSTWTTREVARIRQHLARCPNLPNYLQSEHQPDGLVGDGSVERSHERLVTKRKRETAFGDEGVESGFSTVADHIPRHEIERQREEERESDADWIYQAPELPVKNPHTDFQVSRPQPSTTINTPAKPRVTHPFHLRVPLPLFASFDSREDATKVLVALQEYTLKLTKALDDGNIGLIVWNRENGDRIRCDSDTDEGG